MSGRRASLALALGGSIALALVIGVEAESPSGQIARPSPHAVPAADRIAPPRYSPAPEAAYREIAERPLFVPSRRPQHDAPRRAAPSHGPLFVVQGTVLSPGHRYAVIEYGKPARRESVPEGGTVDGWRVEAITDNGIAVSQDGQRFELPVGEPTKQQGSRGPNQD